MALLAVLEKTPRDGNLVACPGHNRTESWGVFLGEKPEIAASLRAESASSMVDPSQEMVL
jgi:hypothetical protein